MKYISIVISILLVVSFYLVINSEADGKMTGTAGLGRAIMALIIAGVCLLVLVVHGIIIVASLMKHGELSIIYLISVGLPAIPVAIMAYQILKSRS